MPGYNPAIAVSTDKSYTVSFTDETGPFVVTHNLNKRPSVTVLNSDEEEIVVAEDYDAAGDPANSVTLTWKGTLSGRVICN